MKQLQITNRRKYMGNVLEYIYEIKFAKETYDIMTASTSFYRFLGDRLYYTFDMLFDKQEREHLEDMIEQGSIEKVFKIRLLNMQNSFSDFLCVIKEITGESVTLELILLENVYKETYRMRENIENYSTIMSQFNCIYFIYTKATDSVICFRYNPQYQEIMNKPVDIWYGKVKELQTGVDGAKIDEFMYALRNGVRQFRFNFPGQVFNEKHHGKNILVSGNSIYEKGEYVRCVGNIYNPEHEIMHAELRRDQLTGLILKEDITNIAKNNIDQLKRPTTIAIIDIDDFKDVNDTYGHMKGDEVLRRCASIIEDEVDGCGNAGRIGGDEFFIVLDYNEDREKLRSILRSIKNDILSVYSDEKDGFHVSASIGCASYPVDTDNFNDLYMLADYLLYRAKSKGKNRYIIYDPEKHDPVKNILEQGMENLGAHSCRGMTKGEIVCKMTDVIMSGDVYPYENVFNDVVDYFDVERIVLYDRAQNKVLYQCGNKLLSDEDIEATKDYIENPKLLEMFKKHMLINNDIMVFKKLDEELYRKLRKQGILSFMHHHITGASGRKYVVSYESVILKNTWNTEDMYYFRILNHILAKSL
jgi:diguanylate cyclase (GGDEF)-like protein